MFRYHDYRQQTTEIKARCTLITVTFGYNYLNNGKRSNEMETTKGNNNNNKSLKVSSVSSLLFIIKIGFNFTPTTYTLPCLFPYLSYCQHRSPKICSTTSAVPGALGRVQHSGTEIRFYFQLVFFLPFFFLTLKSLCYVADLMLQFNIYHIFEDLSDRRRQVRSTDAMMHLFPCLICNMDVI